MIYTEDKRLPALMFCLLISAVVLHAQTYTITDYGAKGDGERLNTRAIQSAIDACTGTGGTVVVPAGRFVSGTLYLKSNVTLHLNPGAVILGSPRLSDYPVHRPSYRSLHAYPRDDGQMRLNRSLIYADGQANISISGQGTIDGNGNSAEFDLGNDNPQRPKVLFFVSCQNVRVQDVRLQNSAFWMQHYLGCENVKVRGITVYNHNNWNSDGIDIDSRNVTVSDCLFDADDDVLCFKSDGTEVTENVTVTNCILATNCNAIKMGTSGLAGFKNITINNCIIRKASENNFRRWRSRIPTLTADTTVISGIALEMVDGGIMDGINISNIIMTGVITPIFIKLGNRGLHLPGEPVPAPGILKNVFISNIVATNESLITSSVTGMPGYYVENVVIKDVLLNCRGGGTRTDAERIVPENEKAYPESWMFGQSLPCYGFYVRHAKNFSLQNIQLHLLRKDERPALVLDDVKEATLLNCKADAPSMETPLITINQSQDIIIKDSRARSALNFFVKATGDQTRNIVLTGNDLSNCKTAVLQTKEVNKNAVTQ